MQPQRIPVDAVGGVERLDDDSAAEAGQLFWIAGQNPGDVAVPAAGHRGRSGNGPGVRVRRAGEQVFGLGVVVRELGQGFVELGRRPGCAGLGNP